MASSTAQLLTTPWPVDVELPLRRAPAVDVDLTQDDTALTEPAIAGADFQPSLSQIAARPSLTRLRWPGPARPGYHSASNWNWMQDRRAGFGERTLAGI